LPGLIDLANVHPSSSAAGNLKHVPVRGAHFEDTILIAESFYRTLNLYGAIGCIDHCSPLPGRKISTENVRAGEKN
jgi:hypothetical protein